MTAWNEFLSFIILTENIVMAFRPSISWHTEFMADEDHNSSCLFKGAYAAVLGWPYYHGNITQRNTKHKGCL